MLLIGCQKCLKKRYNTEEEGIKVGHQFTLHDPKLRHKKLGEDGEKNQSTETIQQIYKCRNFGFANV